MDNNLSKFDDLIQLMEKTPAVAPSADFTHRVLTRLEKENTGARHDSSAWSFSSQRFMPVQIFQNKFFLHDLVESFRRPVAKTECAFYFLLIGFFYFVLGIILMIGLKPMTASLPVTGWLGIQPAFSLLTALCLLAIGMGLYMAGNAAVRVARIGTLLYAVLIILNGWIGIVSTHVPVAIFIAVIFSVTGLGMVALLGIAIDRYAPENIYSQGVRG